ncbi:MAG: BTAD domain-containing putative transcriptional regulator [Verrucomicrobiota bacterium]
METDNFIVRLPQIDAEIYGDRVLELLNEADEVLSRKYGYEVTKPTLIEFYPNQQDFAIRTFNSLGGEGFLGVCFGPVITMNSPGSVSAGKNNWEATLWHEYAHTITLGATRNKMPRWISEGLSVYEELQKNPAWGQRMTPSYRKMILEGEALTPISQMSDAFFKAESGEEIMFAYYQSMLVVEFIIENYGMEAMRAILNDLGEGVLINDTIARHTTSMPRLEKDFRKSAVELAESYGPEIDWTQPEKSEVDPANHFAVAAFLEQNPKNFWAVQRNLRHLMDLEKWTEVIAAADSFTALLPEFTGADNGYLAKAIAYRELEEPEKEKESLKQLASLSAEALSAYHRLVEISFDAGDWETVLSNAERSMAIHPMVERVHYRQAFAHAALKERDHAVEAFEKSLRLNPTNPSEVNFRLAGLLKSEDQERAKRHLLDALADSPRYLEAHALLIGFDDPEEKQVEAISEE